MIHTKSNVNKKNQGFTLIEIIIALMIISVALGAVITTTASSVDHGAHIKEKTIAIWVAKNHIAELSLSEQWPSIGEKSHEVPMAGKDWFIKSKIIQTPDDNIRRMELSVYTDREHEDKVLNLISYINKAEFITTN